MEKGTANENAASIKDSKAAENKTISENKTGEMGFLKYTWVLFTTAAAIMFVFTYQMQSQSEDRSGMYINLLFLMIMYILIMAAEVIGFRKMRPAIRDLVKNRKQLETHAGELKDAMWESLKGDKEISFQDNEMKNRWKAYISQEYSQTGALILEDEDTILMRFHSSYCDMVPGLLTSLGILGTFIGLIISMKAFSTGNTDTITDSVGTMIGGMNVAFYTSIYGVLLSILFNLTNRRHQQKLTDAVAAFRGYLTENFSAISRDNPMASLVQTEIEIKSMLGELKDKVALSMSQNIVQAMEPIFNRINNSLLKMVGDYRTIQANSMKDAAKDFSAEICRALDSHIDNLGTSVDRLSSSQDDMTHQMQKLLNEIGETMDKTQVINEESEKIIQQFANYLSRLDQLTQNANSVFQQISEYAWNTYQASETQKNSVIELTNLIQDLKSYQEQCARLTVPVHTLVNNLNSAVSANNQGLSQNEALLAKMIADSNANQEKINETLVLAIQSMQTSNEIQMGQMEKLVKSQSVMIEALSEKNAEQSKKFNDAIQKLDKSFNKAINLHGWISESSQSDEDEHELWIIRLLKKWGILR